MKIEGIFSGEELENYSIVIDTYGSLGFKHASYRDEDVKLLLKEMPDFETVFSTFMNSPFILLKANKTLDICLSLFYKPYFDDFYDRVKQCRDRISFIKKRYLIKHMLKYLSDNITYEIIVKRDLIDDKSVRDYFIEKDIYVKSKELLELLK